MLKAMSISSLNMDPVTNSPIIILKEIEGEQTLPIWIGLLEATAIASEIEGVRFPRPMTHDLLKNIMDKTDSRVNGIEICDLRNHTYYALVHLTNSGEAFSIDTRPRVEETRESVPRDKSKQGKKWQDILEKLKPEDFGKYKM